MQGIMQCIMQCIMQANRIREIILLDTKLLVTLVTEVSL